MRFKQLVESNYTKEMEDDITNLLVAVAAEGINTVDTDQLILDLQNMGYSIDKATILDVLNNIGMVANANSETIKLAINNLSRAMDDRTADSEVTHVKKMAQKQAKKDLGL